MCAFGMWLCGHSFHLLHHKHPTLAKGSNDLSWQTQWLFLVSTLLASRGHVIESNSCWNSAFPWLPRGHFPDSLRSQCALLTASVRQPRGSPVPEVLFTSEGPTLENLFPHAICTTLRGLHLLLASTAITGSSDLFSVQAALNFPPPPAPDWSLDVPHVVTEVQGERAELMLRVRVLGPECSSWNPRSTSYMSSSESCNLLCLRFLICKQEIITYLMRLPSGWNELSMGPGTQLLNKVFAK